MLVHEFQTPFTEKGIDKRSSGRIQALLQRFGSPVTDLPLGQLLGPYTVPGGGMIPAEKPFYIAKVRTVGWITSALWSRISRLAIAFFLELGLELEGEATVEGEWVDLR